MLKVLMSFLLFTLPVNTKEEVEIVRCNENEIVIRKVEGIYRVEFFNLLFHDDASKLQACDYLLDAKHVSMELEPLANQNEPLPAYLFADSMLVQKTILEENLGRIAVRMKEYKYEEVMEEASIEAVMASNHGVDVIQQNYNFTYLIVLGILIMGLNRILNHMKQ